MRKWATSCGSFSQSGQLDDAFSWYLSLQCPAWSSDRVAVVVSIGWGRLFSALLFIMLPIAVLTNEV